MQHDYGDDNDDMLKVIDGILKMNTKTYSKKFNIKLGVSVYIRR